MKPTSQHKNPLLSSITGKWTMLSTILASSMAFIDGTALNVILPSLQRDLQATGVDLFWVLNSYLLMLAALIILGGSLGDKLGRVKVFKFGILLFVIGSSLCGFAQDIVQLIVFRTIQGIGGAFMIPGSLAIISAVFSTEEKGKAIGTWSAATTIVTISGPVMGGVLAEWGLWRLIFFINIPLGAVAMYALQYKVPESKEEGASKVDWLGAIMLTLSLALITLACLGVPEWGYDHPLVLISLMLGIALFILFVLLEKKVKEPMVPLSLFKNRTFSGVNILSFFLYAALAGIMLFLSLNIIQIQGYSQFQAGLTFLPFSFIMVAGARLMGKMTDKYGPRIFLIIGPLITGIGILWLSLIGMTNGPEDYFTTYLAPFGIFAIGMAITVVPLTTAVMGCVHESKSGIASGINNSITRISATFMNAIVGAAALILFTNFVLENTSTLTLTPDQKEQILAETSKLGEANVSEAFSEELAQSINHAFSTSFIQTYKWVGILSAMLAFLSSFVAVVMVRSRSNWGA